MEIKELPKTGNAVKKRKKSGFREWIDSVVFAVTAAVLIRWIFFSAFVIPSSSMENSLLVGDYLFVSRLHYGTATPVTPLQIPLTHQTIWGTSIPSYLDWISLPQFRLPGFSEVKRGDVVVFNLPVEHPDLFEKYSTVLPDLKPHPVDLRTNYIKRCVGQPGDRMTISNGQVYYNGKKEANPARMQGEYFVSTSGAINEVNVFKKNGIIDYNQFTENFGDGVTTNDEFGYIVKTTAELAEKLKEFDFVKRIEPVFMPVQYKEPYLFPQTNLFSWNKDQYGPFVVPAKGMKINLTPQNVALYSEIIKSYEGNENVQVIGNRILQNGEVIGGYTFKQDYYFMMGDNRHNSADSRYWGFVPKDHIVGKAIFVWMSIDPDPIGFINKIRWDRLFSVIN
ncbi:signal peptidase I [Dyadobacter psychrotolerans]|uniref:Signal peptidase I n=1 Tax=Dyadobacter psychrotolerans TaxID=2541721 RepID=A0A4R5DUG7_9BACT|nr:signal peptidase I [Dyadobacter psychrotolerans]TDE17417.1 signal peptidase I [Dyadobacter psychrotolerans]